VKLAFSESNVSYLLCNFCTNCGSVTSAEANPLSIRKRSSHFFINRILRQKPPGRQVLRLCGFFFAILKQHGRGRMIDFGESQFRIPKISAPINCLMMSGEKISGEIFVDDLGSHEYTAQQLIDFFNDEPPYFPIRTSIGSKPILIQKSWVAQIEIIGMIKRFQEQAAPLVSQKRAILHR